MKTESIKKFELSYPVQVTNWDGKMITLVPENEILKQIEVLKKVGIRWCMIAGFQIEEPLGFDIFDGAKACGELIEAAGMQVSSHHNLFSTFAPLDSSQENVRQRMLQTIDFCSLLKTEVLVIHPGRLEGKHVDGASVNQSFERELKRHGMNRVLDVVADNFRVMGNYAAKFGIKLALETMGRFEPLGSIDVLPGLINRVDLPNVGYCLDSGHAHAFGESVVEWVKLAGDKLFTTHFHDNRGTLAGVELPGMFIEACKQYDEHNSPGFGTIPWIDVINTLRKIDYKFPVNFETGGWPVDDPAESYKMAIDWWHTCETISTNACYQSTPNVSKIQR